MISKQFAEHGTGKEAKSDGKNIYPQNIIQNKAILPHGIVSRHNKDFYLTIIHTGIKIIHNISISKWVWVAVQVN